MKVNLKVIQMVNGPIPWTKRSTFPPHSVFSQLIISSSYSFIFFGQLHQFPNLYYLSMVACLSLCPKVKLKQPVPGEEMFGRYYSCQAMKHNVLSQEQVVLSQINTIQLVLFHGQF